MSMCSVFIQARSPVPTGSAADVRQLPLQPLDDSLELVAPPGVVGARQAAQLDVTVPGRCRAVSRTQTRRRRTTSDTTSPAIIVSANTSTQIWAGSWETCRLMNGTAPSNRTTVPSSSRVCCAGAQVDPRLLGEPLLLDEPRVQGEQRLRPAGVQPGVTAVDVDGHRRVVQRREARRQQGAVELLGRREQALDGDLVLAPLVGVGIACRRAGRTRITPEDSRVIGSSGPPLHGLSCGSARRGRSR